MELGENERCWQSAPVWEFQERGLNGPAPIFHVSELFNLSQQQLFKAKIGFRRMQMLFGDEWSYIVRTEVGDGSEIYLSNSECVM